MIFCFLPFFFYILCFYLFLSFFLLDFWYMLWVGVERTFQRLLIPSSVPSKITAKRMMVERMKWKSRRLICASVVFFQLTWQVFSISKFLYSLIDFYLSFSFVYYTDFTKLVVSLLYIWWKLWRLKVGNFAKTQFFEISVGFSFLF